MQDKKIDEKQQHMEHLLGVVEIGKSTWNMYEDMSEIEVIIEERIQDFMESAPKYNEI